MFNAAGFQTGTQKSIEQHRQMVARYWEAVGTEENADLSLESHLDRREQKINTDFEKSLTSYLRLKLEGDGEGREDVEVFLRTCEGYDSLLSSVDNLAALPGGLVRRAYDRYMHDKTVKLPSEVASDAHKRAVVEKAQVELENVRARGTATTSDIMIGVMNGSRPEGEQLATWTKFAESDYPDGSFEQGVKALGPGAYMQFAGLIAIASRSSDPALKKLMLEVLIDSQTGSPDPRENNRQAA